MMKRIGRWLRAMTARGRMEREMESELRAHVEMRAEDLQRGGLGREEALRRAKMEFGGIEQAKEEIRDVRGVSFVEGLWQDLRFGGRMLAKSPGFTAIVVIILALGIGANTAVFSMVNALLLRPYPFRELDRLVRVWEERGSEASLDARDLAAADAEDLRAEGVFEELSTYADKSFNTRSGGETEALLGCRVSANFFKVLGATPLRGRAFSTEEERGGEQVAVISYALWQREFGGEDRAVGKTLKLEGRPYTVVGIMPKDFTYPVPVTLWVPLGLNTEERRDRAQMWMAAVGRLKPGVSVRQAGERLANASRKLAETYPKTNSGRSAHVLLLRKELYTYTVPLFMLLQACAGLVLLLACANLANLVFVHMMGRQKELALRRALGADRARLAQLFVCEAVLLSTIAGCVAMAASLWSVKALRTSIPVNWTKWVPGWDGIQVDATVSAFAALLALLVGVVFGLVAMRGGDVDVSQTLKESGTAAGSPSKWRLRNALVVAQVIFALLLLTCAAQTMQGFWRLAEVYAGFQPASVMRFEIALPEKEYADKSSIAGFYRRLLEAVNALPGTESASLITNPPASNVDSETTQFTVDERAVMKPEELPEAELQTASAGYFATLHVPLIAGRGLEESDIMGAPKAAVISRSTATRYFPNGDAVGHTLKLRAADSAEKELTIVGVVGDVRQNWWNSVNRNVIYQVYTQAPQNNMTLLLRGPQADQQVRAVREAVAGIDPQIALQGVNTLQEEIAESIAIVRIMGTLMIVFGGVALLLSMLGVYGVLAENVAQRTREIGVRLALGASAGSMKRMVLAQALRLTCIGLAIALPLSLAVGRVLTGLLFGIVTVDVALLVAMGVLFVGIALLAAYGPAQRATRVDPMVALRWE
jgi:putative ABC transport system permease protein